MSDHQQAKDIERRLAEVISPRGRVLTAYSGGIDSTLVAAMARQTLGKDNAPAAIGDSASLPRFELEEARQIAEQLDIELIEVVPNEQDDARYRANESDRCYHCKAHLYESLHDLAKEMGIEFIASGTNADDLGDHRPGIDAAKEAKVISPLVEAGITKQEIRVLAQYLDLPNWDKPAAACLASRIPYGEEVTVEKLMQVERAEDVLRELGFSGYRVRHHDNMARLEVPLEQFGKLLEDGVREKVISELKELGYLYIALDIEGFRSGSGNLVLPTVGISG